MSINLEKINEIYGKDFLIEIKENYEDIIENLTYLTKYNINNIYEILESFPYIFIEDPEQFQNKIDIFINDLGQNYKEKLELDMSLWGKLE